LRNCVQRAGIELPPAVKCEGTVASRLSFAEEYPSSHAWALPLSKSWTQARSTNAMMGHASRGANNVASSAMASKPCKTATLRAARPLGKGG